MSETSNIYDILDKVQKRPGMWIGDGADQLSSLETIIRGYYIGLNAHNVVEGVRGLDRNEFANWLHRKTGIGAALGWAHIINELYPDPNEAFNKFFEYLQAYKNE